MRTVLGLVIAVVVVCGLTPPTLAEDAPDIYARENLVAWCIVPFDGKKRGPAERAAMCAKLGFKKVAYDWRDEHVASFEEEILEYQKNGLEYFAFWGMHDEAFRLFKKYDLHPQIWMMIPAPQATDQAARVQEAARSLLPAAERAKALGCQVGLYNHGGWQGEPENMVAVCRELREQHQCENVGIVYNQHHAHDRIDDFGQVIQMMRPYLLCLNLNGMSRNGDKVGKKILPIGEGEVDVVLLKAILESGYVGPIGIIGHTQDDVELRLSDNLDGLDWIRPQLAGRPAGAKPKPRTWSPEIAPAPRQVPGSVLPGKAEYRAPPLTVECRVRLTRKDGYNILAANDTKASGSHWEIFTVAGSGMLAVYTPGLSPDHTHSTVMLCDSQPHQVVMEYHADSIRLFVDGKSVARQAVQSQGRASLPGDFAIGRLVEGGMSHAGTIEWVRVSSGIRESRWQKPGAPPRDEQTLLLWTSSQKLDPNADPTTGPSTDATSKSSDAGKLFGPRPDYSSALAAELLQQSAGADAARGLMVFADARSACLSCHKVGQYGGTVGPALTELAKQRPANEIVEAVIWPQRHVKPEYQTHVIVTVDGEVHKGYIRREDKRSLVLYDPAKAAEVTVAIADIDERKVAGSLMPENLTAAMSKRQLLDVLGFLLGLGKDDQELSLTQVESIIKHSYAHTHGPAEFEYARPPLEPERWAHDEHPVNRDRTFEFYRKEATHFREIARSGELPPPLLLAFPGLDGGQIGHWGNQNEATWASDAWNSARLGSVQGGIFRGAGVTVARGVCVRVSDDNDDPSDICMSCCFNPDTLSYDAVWSGGFLGFSSVRHGFMNGVTMGGTALPTADLGVGPNGRAAPEDSRYEGYYRVGSRIGFVYSIDGIRYLDSPRSVDGEFERQVATWKQHPLAAQTGAAPRQWPERIVTKIQHGVGSPYSVDTIELPFDNPWNVPLFVGGVGFLADGTALVCTMHGDVWRVEGTQFPSTTATWSRFASGLHHCQGIVVDEQGIFVLGRDQITRLHDLNNDGEADFYECFSKAYDTSPAGHDFICGLVRDAEGRFYTASGNQGIVQISADGTQAKVVASGFRNPDGIGLTSDGVVTVPCSEGGWTPATMICAFPLDDTQATPFFGFGGPRNDVPPSLPLAYLPRGVDNSAGGQCQVDSDRWGPLAGQLLHLSFGTGTHFTVLRDEVDGQMQGAIAPLPGDFTSGAHRGCFNPVDGQLYVGGMQGWGCYTPQHGCFQRVRYTGADAQLPIGIKTYRNGVLIDFSNSLDESVAASAVNHFAQCWNYRYSSAYGSPEFSTRHFGMRGHDHLSIRSAHVVKDGKSLFLEIPDLQPVNQLHLLLQPNAGIDRELFVTVHALREESFTESPGLSPMDDKLVLPHPILSDLALATRTIPNPFKRKNNGRPIKIETGTNLTFATNSVTVKPGEKIELTLANPDVVPHNWVLIRPGTLHRVGDLTNRLISDPEAALRHYVPQSTDVLAYTDIVMPKDQFTIYFEAPIQPGRYPYLCTFPGHWLVMNGELIVAE